jgi:hypothetical protein
MEADGTHKCGGTVVLLVLLISLLENEIFCKYILHEMNSTLSTQMKVL